MTVIAVTSTRSSPGVSALAVGLGFVWQQLGADPVLVEADPAGGVTGLRFGLSSEPSIVTLSSDMRRGFEPGMVGHSALDLHGLDCVLGPTDPLIASRVLERHGERMAAGFASIGRPVVADIGRLYATSPALAFAEAADRVLLLSRPRVDEVQSLLYGIRLLKSRRCAVSLVLVGNRPFHPDEIADLAGIPLAGVLPDERLLAAALIGGRFSARKLKRSLLWRSITALGVSLLDQYWAEPVAPTVHESTTISLPRALADRREPPPPVEPPVRVEPAPTLVPGHGLRRSPEHGRVEPQIPPSPEPGLLTPLELDPEPALDWTSPPQPDPEPALDWTSPPQPDPEPALDWTSPPQPDPELDPGPALDWPPPPQPDPESAIDWPPLQPDPEPAVSGLEPSLTDEPEPLAAGHGASPFSEPVLGGPLDHAVDEAASLMADDLVWPTLDADHEPVVGSADPMIRVGDSEPDPESDQQGVGWVIVPTPASGHVRGDHIEPAAGEADDEAHIWAVEPAPRRVALESVESLVEPDPETESDRPLIELAQILDTHELFDEPDNDPAWSAAAHDPEPATNFFSDGAPVIVSAEVVGPQPHERPPRLLAAPDVTQQLRVTRVATNPETWNNRYHPDDQPAPPPVPHERTAPVSLAVTTALGHEANGSHPRKRLSGLAARARRSGRRNHAKPDPERLPVTEDLDGEPTAEPSTPGRPAPVVPPPTHRSNGHD